MQRGSQSWSLTWQWFVLSSALVLCHRILRGIQSDHLSHIYDIVYDIETQAHFIAFVSQRLFPWTELNGVLQLSLWKYQALRVIFGAQKICTEINKSGFIMIEVCDQCHTMWFSNCGARIKMMRYILCKYFAKCRSLFWTDLERSMLNTVRRVFQQHALVGLHLLFHSNRVGKTLGAANSLIVTGMANYLSVQFSMLRHFSWLQSVQLTKFL